MNGFPPKELSAPTKRDFHLHYIKALLILQYRESIKFSGIKKPPNQAVRSQDMKKERRPPNRIRMALALFPKNRSKTKDTHSVGSYGCHIETSAPDQQNYMGNLRRTGTRRQLCARCIIAQSPEKSKGISDNFCPSGDWQLCISSIYCVYKRYIVR